MSEITCPDCGRVSPADHTFCTGCGSRLSPGPVPEGEAPADETPTQALDLEHETQQAYRDELASVRGELQDAALLIEQLQERISRLEGNAVAPAQPQQPGPAAPSTAPAQASAPPQDAVPAGVPEGAPMPAAAGEGAAPAQGGGDSITDDLQPGGFSIDWEQVLGRNWLAIIGALALVLGIGFFLKLAFDNNWIGDTGRVALGIVAGLALLGAGEYASRHVPLWSRPVTAGGAAILYLSIYAAFGLYQLIRPDVAFLFLALVVALAGLLALRYESIVIAILGIIGAFLAPVLLGPNLPDDRLVLLYIIVVDLGILGVSTFRNWRWFTLLGLVGSYGLFSWKALDILVSQPSMYDLLLAQAALTVVFLTFAGVTTLFHLIWRRVPGPADMSLMSLNAIWFFALTVALLWEDYEIWFGLIALGMALFYGLTAFAAMKRNGAPPQIALFSLPIAVMFLTIAIPLQVSGLWVTVAWAAQGAALIWVGFLLRTPPHTYVPAGERRIGSVPSLYQWPVRILGLGNLALAAGHLALFDSAVPLDGFTPILNERFPVFVVVIAAFCVSAFIYRRYRDLAQERERFMVPVLAAIANLLTLALLSLEVIDYFDSLAWAAPGVDYFSAKHLSLTVLWAVYAIGVIGVGIAQRSSRIRLAGMALLAVPVVKLFVFDVFLLERGYRVAAFVTLGALLLGTGLIYQRYSQAIRRFLFGQRA